MESLRLSYQAIAPVFILMLLGYILKVLKVADKRGFDVVNKLVFKVFLPVLLFYNIYNTAPTKTFDMNLIVFTVVGIFVVFFCGYFAVLGLSRENSKRGVMLQGFFRTNFAILGVPLVSYICGESSKGLASLMVAVIVPFFNVLAVIALERFRGGRNKLNIWHMFKGIITNPLIISCIVGF